MTSYINYKSLPINTYSAPVILQENNQSYCFVILRHVSNKEQDILWVNCYNSIRKFYNNKIIIIDDNSSYTVSNKQLINTEIIQSEFPGAGESLPYYYFYKYKWSDNMIFLHDSMYVIRPFLKNELQYNFSMFWNFNNIICLNLEKVENIIQQLENKDILLKSLHEYKWQGCFGASSIININILNRIEEKYKCFETFVNIIKTREQRMCIERLIGIILNAENINSKSLFGNIHTNYPMSFTSFSLIDSLNIIRRHKYNTAICKLWIGR